MNGLAAVIGAGVGIALLAAAAAPPSRAQGGATIEPPPQGYIAGRSLATVGGPKRTVAVGKFESTGAFNSRYGNWDVGGGLAAMLATALIESGRFIVVERANLSQVITEQELKASGVASKETGPELGRISGAQLLVFGAVTEFGTDDQGSGVSVGVSRGGSSPFGVPLGGGGVAFPFGLGGGGGTQASGSYQTSSGAVAMDVRVVDATTSAILAVHKVKEPIEGSGFDVSVGYKGVSLGGNQYWKTPLGEATRKAVGAAVEKIVASAGSQPWSGLVVEVNGAEVAINAGSNTGFRPGDRFMIERVVRRLTDPATGQVLSARKQELGLLDLTEVENAVAFGRYQPLSADPPRRGDLVVPAR